MKNLFGHPCPEFSSEEVAQSSKDLVFLEQIYEPKFNLEYFDMTWNTHPGYSEDTEVVPYNTEITNDLSSNVVIDFPKKGCQDCLVYLSRCYCEE